MGSSQETCVVHRIAGTLHSMDPTEEAARRVARAAQFTHGTLFASAFLGVALIARTADRSPPWLARPLRRTGRALCRMLRWASDCELPPQLREE